ncbi:MAG: sigma-70 family RNA polymerase sigma factor, partial [Planctomycetota bacterium]
AKAREKTRKGRPAVSRRMSDSKRADLVARAGVLLRQENRFIFVAEFETLRGDRPITEAIELLEELQLQSTGSDSECRPTEHADGEDSVSLQNWSAPDPLLTFENEQVLFRALNLLRYRINQLRSKLSELTPVEKLIVDIEEKLILVERIRAQLVNSNLRLVASIARRFSTSFGDVDDFSSDGCMILLGAIDRFDYSRRFRFSTYATHSIQRHFFRAWKVRQRRRERFPNLGSEMLNEMPQVDVEGPVCEDPESVVSDLLSHAESVLDEREHQILLHRFGLGGKDRAGRTLREIAADLGISKERVRQLQMKALEKLKSLLDPDKLSVAWQLQFSS